MIYFFIAISMTIIVGYMSYGIGYENNRRKENKNDERWQSVVAKADSTALSIFYLTGSLMAVITLLSEIFKSFNIVQEMLSRENLLEIYKYYTLVILCIVFAVRTHSLKRYDQEM